MRNSDRPYSYRIERGATQGWCYEILGPTGIAICYGARLGNRKEVESHVRKIVHRLNASLGTRGENWREVGLRKLEERRRNGEVL